MKFLALLSFGLIFGLNPVQAVSQQAVSQNDEVLEPETDPGDYSELFATPEENQTVSGTESESPALESADDHQEVKAKKDKKAKKAKKDKKKKKHEEAISSESGPSASESVESQTEVKEKKDKKDKKDKKAKKEKEKKKKSKKSKK